MAKKVQRSNMVQTDSKGNVTRAPRTDENDLDNPNKFYWWKADDSDIAAQIAATVKYLQTHNNNRLEQLTVSTRLYGNTSAYSLLGTAFTRSSSVVSNPQSQRISFNLCASVIDTLTAKVAKNRVIPTFATNNGNWKIQRKAEKLNQFCDGLAYQNDIPRKVINGFRDSGVWGLGLVKVHEDGGKVCVTRTFPHEIWWDQIEALGGEIRQLHQVRTVDRSVVLEMFPDMAEEIESALPANYQDLGGMGTVADLLTITESWHLRSGPDAKDGKHVICVNDICLNPDDMEWNKDYFPFPVTRYTKRLLGFDGQSACERLQSLQGEINRNMILIQRSHWMGGSFKVLLENGSKVVSQHLNNDVGTLIHYTGTPPQYITPPVIQQDVYNWVDSLIQKGYKQEGVSEMTAGGVKQPGVDSGRALREMTNIEEDRFLFMQQEVESFALEIYRQCIEVAKDIYKKTGKYEVIFPGSSFIETIDWKDINLDSDQYVLKAYPTSSLPEDPAGRLQTIQEYMQAGIVSPKHGRWLMTKLDLAMSDSLANASEDLLHKMIEELLEDGADYGGSNVPETFNDLAMAKELVLQYYNYAKLHNAPEENLQNLRDFNTAVDDLTGVNVPPPPPGAPGVAAPIGMPQANPTPTPTSPLLPNVPGAA